jgi:hypothetical protein
MSEPKTRKVRAWVQLGTHYIEDDIELPEDCFDEAGGIISSDAAEFVEIWINDTLNLSYGGFIPGSPEDPRK